MAFKEKIQLIASQVATEIANQICNQKLMQVNQSNTNNLGKVVSITNQNQLVVQLPDGTQSSVYMINSRPIGINDIVVIPAAGVAL